MVVSQLMEVYATILHVQQHSTIAHAIASTQELAVLFTP